jgi:hypothetical protein
MIFRCFIFYLLERGDFHPADQKKIAITLVRNRPVWFVFCLGYPENKKDLRFSGHRKQVGYSYFDLPEEFPVVNTERLETPRGK